VRPLVPLASSATVLVAWGLVAHNSGAGWVQAVGDALAGALVVGLLGPALVVARARVRVVDTPTDGTARLPVELAVEASTRLRVDAVDPKGAQDFVGPGRAGRGGHDALVVVPVHRGAYSTLTIDVASGAPFGLLWWRRRVAVTLPRQLVVAPRTGEAVALPHRRDDSAGETSARVPVPVGEPRGVRPYRTGDPRRWVHWPASAHTGELMVREMEGPSADAVTVRVHLPLDDDAAERVAERALGTVVALLDRGWRVVLATTEDDGPKLDVVVDRRSAGRRLARAVPDVAAGGPPAGISPGVDVAVVRGPSDRYAPAVAPGTGPTR
jgi:uncharacterized protein (DUF58 family)